MIAMMRAVFDRRLNPRVSEHSTTIPFGPFFNTSTQKRWRRKPASTAKTRLQDTRVKDSHFDRLSSALKKLTVVIKYHEIITGTTANIGAFSSVQIISVWKRRVGLTGKVGAFLRKYPHVFDVFPHPVRRSLCCRLTDEASNLIAEEEKAVRDSEHQTVDRLKKFLRMTVDGKVSVHTLFHVRREMGLGRDFVTSILEKYNDVFDLDVENGTVELVVAAEAEAKEEVLAAVEIWREREYREKWLSALDTEFAFPLHFPNGFKKPPGFRDTIKNWQRLPYRKPYEEKKKERRGKSRVESGSRKRYEKRAVSLIHEFLSLTVEKMVEVERLTRLRKDLGMLVNVREVLLRHPGIFYISTRGFTLRVFLRESYHRGVLLDPNPVHFARTKMLGLLMVPRHHRLQGEELAEEGRVLLEKEILASHEAERRGAKKDKDWVLPLLDTLKDT